MFSIDLIPPDALALVFSQPLTEMITAKGKIFLLSRARPAHEADKFVTHSIPPS
jgi:hypothetical protein